MQMKMNWCYLLVSLLVAGVASGDQKVVLNQAVDQFLQGLSQEVIATGKDNLPVPNFSTSWHFRKHFLKVSGQVGCEGGEVGRLSTLRRTGDVVMTTAGSKVTLRLALGLGELKAKFSKCRAKVHRLFSVSSKLEAAVKDNSVAAQVSLEVVGGKCVTKIEQLGLANIGRIELKTGGGVFHKVVDKLLDALANHFRSDFKKTVDSHLMEAATKQLAKNPDLCSKVMPK